MQPSRGVKKHHKDKGATVDDGQGLVRRGDSDTLTVRGTTDSGRRQLVRSLSEHLTTSAFHTAQQVG